MSSNAEGGTIIGKFRGRKLRVLVLYGGPQATLPRAELLAWLRGPSVGIEARIVSETPPHSDGAVDDRVEASIQWADKAIAIITPDERSQHGAPNVMDEIARWRSGRSKASLCMLRHEDVPAYSNHDGLVFVRFKERVGERFEELRRFLAAPTPRSQTVPNWVYIVLALFVAGLAILLVSLATRTESPPVAAPAASARVELLFGRAEDPVYWIVNRSPGTVERPKYEFAVFNLNVADTRQPGMWQIARIPARILNDYILPGRALGPHPLRELSPVLAQAKKGHVLFGLVTVQCANCGAAAVYWIFVNVGGNGWYREVGDAEVEQAWRTLGRIVNTMENPVALLEEQVSRDGRKPFLNE